MTQNRQNKMMGNQEGLNEYHFANAGISAPMTIRARTQEEAIQIYRTRTQTTEENALPKIETTLENKLN